jgi:hypothetical protein
MRNGDVGNAVLQVTAFPHFSKMQMLICRPGAIVVCSGSAGGLQKECADTMGWESFQSSLATIQAKSSRCWQPRPAAGDGAIAKAHNGGCHD